MRSAITSFAVSCLGRRIRSGAGPAPATQTLHPRRRRPRPPAACSRPGGREAPRRSDRRKPLTQQTYLAEQVRAGQVLFVSQCGFCHGRDAMGGETGPDLTRSQVVAEDVAGDKIGPVVRSGRPEKGMPPFNLSGRRPRRRRRVHPRSETQGGVARGQSPDRRCRRPADRERAGGPAILQRRRRLREVSHRRPATSPGWRPGCKGCSCCSGCSTRAGAAAAAGAVRGDGDRHAGRRRRRPGKLAYRDEFTIALTDENGWYRSWPIARVKVAVDDQLEAHAAAAAEVHRRGHARRARLPADAEITRATSGKAAPA